MSVSKSGSPVLDGKKLKLEYDPVLANKFEYTQDCFKCGAESLLLF
jgi:hypothetical protein